jgi:hypothetical protein
MLIGRGWDMSFVQQGLTALTEALGVYGQVFPRTSQKYKFCGYARSY